MKSLSREFSDSRLFFAPEPEEKELLPHLSSLIEALAETIVEKLTNYILRFEEGRRILGPLWSQRENPSHPQTRLRNFILQFFRDPFSEEVFQEALKVGRVHAEKGVKAAFFLSALSRLFLLLEEDIKKQVKDPAFQERLIRLTGKLLFYLGSVSLGAYFKRLGQELEEAYTEIDRLNRIYVLLREINLLIFEERVSSERLFEEACEILVKHGGFALAWIGLIHPETKEVKPLASAGKTGFLKGFYVSMDPAIAEGRGPCGEALRTGKPVVVSDTEKDPKFALWREKARRHGLRSVVALPLVRGNEVRGGLFLYHQEPQHFTPEEVRLLFEISRDLSLGWSHIENSRELERVLFRDELTGLGNERYLSEALEHEFEISKRKNQKLALVLLDLDEFSLLNHSLGRAVGDEVLKEVGKRLVQVVGHRGTVVRSGADEFACSYLFETEAERKSLLERIKTALSFPVYTTEETIRVSASIGCAVFPEEASSPERLLEAASAALRKAKKQGPGAVAFYSEKEAQEILSRWRLIEELEQAWEKKEFVLFFQPRVNLFSRKVSSFEALLRWKHPERGLIPPGEFIPVLEETGLIIKVGDWVIRESAQFLKKLLSIDPEISLSFNVSVKQFLQDDLLKVLAETLREVSLPRGSLEVEITESLFLEAGERASEILEGINRLGLKLAIDDFGTGYSSFAYLKKIPAETLKIDYSFIKGLPENREDASVVMAIAAMARNLDKKLVAEGVERREQLAFLMGLGVDEVQGYYFARPMPAEEALSFLESFELESFFK